MTSLYPEHMSYGEDLVFSLNYLENCERILFIPDAPYLHNNLNSNSIVHTFKPQRLTDLELAQNRVIEFGGENYTRKDAHKYIKDASHLLFSLYSAENYTFSEKASMIKEWHKNSYLKELNIEDFQIEPRKKLMLKLVQSGHYKSFGYILGIKKIINKCLSIRR